MRYAPLLASAGLVFLSACASTAASDQVATVQAVTPISADATPYGLFLAGHAAAQGGDNTVATDYFARAGRLSGSAEVLEEAFFASVLSGDIDRAAALAPQAGAPGGVRLGRLVIAVEALADGNAKQALAAMSGEPIGYPHRAAGALLKPWVAAAAGDMQTATAEPGLKSDRLAFNLGSLARAELLERARRYDEAEQVLKTMSAQSDTGGVFGEAYGEFLERRGRRAEALALYDAALANAPADPRLTAVRARAAAGGKPPPLPDLRSGAASALTGAAAGAMLLKQNDLSLVYLRLALRLDGESDEAWMLLGDNLAATGDAAAARAAYARVTAKSPSFVEARSRTIWTHQGSGDQAVALELARDTLRQAPDSALAQLTLADVLRVNKQYDESVRILDGLIEAADDKTEWRLLYLRGLALDKAGRWPDAERDFQAGLKLAPDEPELLNYLGYSWIDRGERLDEALGMIQQALLAQPNSGAIVDSLGWAFYRLGQYDKAVQQLERAAQLEPADAEINSHLGDAYWQVGRRIEAEFQWRKVLTTMTASEEMKAALEAKLKSGMTPAPPARVAGR